MENYEVFGFETHAEFDKVIDELYEMFLDEFKAYNRWTDFESAAYALIKRHTFPELAFFSYTTFIRAMEG